MINEVFWENFSQRFVALIFTLLLVPFESKLVKFSTHSPSLDNSKSKSMFYIAFEANRTN